MVKMAGAHTGRLWPIDKAWPSQLEMAKLVRVADKLAGRGHDWAAHDYNVLVKAYLRRGGHMSYLIGDQVACPKGCTEHYHVGQGR